VLLTHPRFTVLTLPASTISSLFPRFSPECIQLTPLRELLSRLFKPALWFPPSRRKPCKSTTRGNPFLSFSSRLVGRVAVVTRCQMSLRPRFPPVLSSPNAFVSFSCPTVRSEISSVFLSVVDQWHPLHQAVSGFCPPTFIQFFIPSFNNSLSLTVVTRPPFVPPGLRANPFPAGELLHNRCHAIKTVGGTSPSRCAPARCCR